MRENLDLIFHIVTYKYLLSIGIIARVDIYIITNLALARQSIPRELRGLGLHRQSVCKQGQGQFGVREGICSWLGDATDCLSVILLILPRMLLHPGGQRDGLTSHHEFPLAAMMNSPGLRD